MPEFQYLARELTGREIRGSLSAASEAEAAGTLTLRDLFPVWVRPAAAATPRTTRRVRPAAVAAFYSQLSDLLRSGVPLLRAIDVVRQESTQSALGTILADVRARVSNGSPLADAMEAHPRHFPEFALGIVRAGEQGGFLEDSLARLAAFTEHQEELKGRVVGALVYPLFLVGVGAVVVTAMLVFFVPNFNPVFERLKERGEMPVATTLLLGVSDGLRDYGLWLLAAALFVAWRAAAWARTGAGRDAIDRWRLAVPGLGPIVRGFGVARFCRLLGTLLHNGVPILPALRTARHAMGSRALSDPIGKAAESVSTGRTLAQPLAASGQFPTDVLEMIAVGEAANRLDQVLVEIADRLERRTSRRLDLFVRLLEPVTLLLLAGVILFLVLALLLPVFQTTSAFS